MTTKGFAWTNYYMELADRLLPYKSRRGELLELLQDAYSSANLRYPLVEGETPLRDVCPFTVFGCFNKGLTTDNRITILGKIGQRLGVEREVPTLFHGVPFLNNLRAWFFSNSSDLGEDDIPNLWRLFEAALVFTDHPDNQSLQGFSRAYETVRVQPQVKWNMTMGLFWIRPYAYLNLDARNRSYLLSGASVLGSTLQNITKLREVPDVNQYLELLEIAKIHFDSAGSRLRSFPELSHEAWQKGRGEQDAVLATSEMRHWIYSPGRGSSKWPEFYEKRIMGIGRDAMGDFRHYKSKDSLGEKLTELVGVESSHKNRIHMIWQFTNEMKPGDIVYAKRGTDKVIGRGIVESDYIFDQNRDEYKHIRRVNWTHQGEWDHPGHLATKTLTDITAYTDYVRTMESLFDIDEIETVEPDRIRYEPYSDADFLTDVFMDDDRYSTLTDLVRRKKNVILQGAPGVGKTFIAKRLAYSMLGERDTSRVVMVQFHQSYSYEDFIMGYRPTATGFELVTGPFYEFCKVAQEDEGNDYFFLIDEINRGNLSKIFGELLMLIEADKRKERLRLLYANELFSVPANVHVIGMMNTADRSLALMDYALRRRFAFFDIEPAFDSIGFGRLLELAANPKFDAVVGQIKALNAAVAQDESLGEGFRIGHSYLCTNEEVTDSWLSAVVKFEIIPLLEEYWFDEKDKVEHWTQRLYRALHD